MEPILLVMLTMAAREQLKPEPAAETDAAFFSDGRNA